MIWNDEKVRKLRDLWSAGLSGSQIAKKLKTTRSAILGKAHRLNLQSRTSGRNKVVAPKTIAVAPKTIAVVRKKPAAAKQPYFFDALLSLKDGLCHYPIGHVDQPGFHFCLAPALTHKPYCSEHYGLCYEPKKDR